ncbi:MAG: NnrS family protein [Candidatus Obscuribacterales bacterium]
MSAGATADQFPGRRRKRIVSKQSGVPSFLLREKHLITLLLAYLLCGMFFMLVPGTLIGVWNLLSISGQHSSAATAAGWIDAHGHAQLFGWVSTFVLGIGYYNLPNLRKTADHRFVLGWAILILWASGVGLHWMSAIWQWQPHLIMPLSAVLEVVAVALFLFASFQGHERQKAANRKIDVATMSIIGGSFGLLAGLVLILWQSLAYGGVPPAETRLLPIITVLWLAIVPIAVGLSARWFPAIAGTAPYLPGAFLLALLADVGGVGGLLWGFKVPSAISILLACGAWIYSLRIFVPAVTAAKTIGVHPSFPAFLRLSYLWLLIAAALAAWSAIAPQLIGMPGASRHAVTVGFMSTLVLTVGPRMLPAFLGRDGLFSPRLMFLSLLFINSGCLLRVISQILGYQGSFAWAWCLLPLSGLIELLGFTLFVSNMILTVRKPARIDQLLKSGT